MTPPQPSKKVLLLPAGTWSGTAGHAPLRRYRLARLRFDTSESRLDKRVEYLKRTYD